MIKKYEIDIRQYKAVRKLKSGGFGSVFLVEDIKTKENYAAKIIDPSDTLSKKMINREIGIMIRLNHPTIIKFYGYSLRDFYDNDNVTVIMQFATKGSLAELLKNVQDGFADHDYDNTSRQKILIGIARGMKYLHQNHAIHRDLKPENILLDDNLEPCITDFGLSKFVNIGETNNQTQTAGTYIYMAPEVIKSGQYNGKADVFSFAILMYQVVTDLVPFPEFHKRKITPYQLNTKILENCRPEFSVPVKPKIRQLIEKCWSDDPKDRPTFDEIYNRLSKNIEETVYNIFEDNDNFEYYLDDVDVDEVMEYIDRIDGDNENTSYNKLTSLIQKMNLLEKESSSKISQLEEENIQMKQLIRNLESQNKELKESLSSKISLLSKENEQIKHQLNELKKETIVKRSEPLNQDTDIIQADKDIKMAKKLKDNTEKDQSKNDEKAIKNSSQISDKNPTENDDKIVNPIPMYKDEFNEIRIHISLCYANNLTKIKVIKKPNPYLIFRLKSQLECDVQCSEFCLSTVDPKWSSELDLYTLDQNDVLLINMNHHSNDENNEPMMDEIELPINSISSLYKYVRKNYKLTLKGKNAGTLSFCIEKLNTIKPDIEPLCTYLISGTNYIEQRIYNCFTCNLISDNDQGICEACARKCHKNHKISYQSFWDEFYCDCPGESSCSYQCMNTCDIRCTAIETSRKPVNQMMYICKDCSSNFLICQNCAIKFHHGHNLKCLGIVQSKVCQNDQIIEKKAISNAKI